MTRTSSPTTFPVLFQRWEESERGWGTRPDGYTLHVSLDECTAYRDKFMKDQHARMGSTPPNEYTRPCGEPDVIQVSKATYDDLVAKNAEGKPYWGPSGSWKQPS